MSIPCIEVMIKLYGQVAYLTFSLVTTFLSVIAKNTGNQIEVIRKFLKLTLMLSTFVISCMDMIYFRTSCSTNYLT